MEKFKMTATEINTASAKFHYKVFDKDGKLIGQRKSHRAYVACYVFGEPGQLRTNFWFGRHDLIGKGDSAHSTPTGVAMIE